MKTFRQLSEELQLSENKIVDYLGRKLDERIITSDYTPTSEPSPRGGHKAKVVKKENNRAMYLSQHSYKNPEDAKEHAKTYLNAYATIGSSHADRKVNDFVKSNKDKLYQKEEYDIESMLEYIEDLETQLGEENKAREMAKDVAGSYSSSARLSPSNKAGYNAKMIGPSKTEFSSKRTALGVKPTVRKNWVK
jgi:hypothetical protein